MTQVILPPKKGHFYSLNVFFTHIHDEKSASYTYVIPWENAAIIIPRRDHKKAGCVGCVVRRVISTTYHRKEKICGIDSVWCDSEELEKIIPVEKSNNNEPISSTKCFLYRFDTKNLEEIHILPVPSCSCSCCSPPSISPDFVETWLQKWPNVVLQKTLNKPYAGMLHLYSTKLPNVASLFVRNKISNTCVPSSPTVASLRDEVSLSKRLLGESIERYVLHHVPLEQLFTEPEESATLSKDRLDVLKSPLWTKVVNAQGEEVFYKADEVFGGLHKLYSSQFRPLSSSGAAAHTDVESAKTHALLELIERDTLLVAWRLADHINLFQSLPLSLSESRQKKWIEKLAFQQEQELVVCAVRNQFNLPVVLAASLPRSDSCKFGPNFGSGISFSWEIAYKKALTELLQGLAIPDSEVCEEAPISFNERRRYWAHPKRLPILRKRLTAEKESNVCTDTCSLNDLIQKFDKFKLSLYFANLTTPDVALSHWKVLRAICPHFEPFVGNAHYEKPNLERVNLCLISMNEKPINHLNNDPFPFP